MLVQVQPEQVSNAASGHAMTREGIQGFRDIAQAADLMVRGSSRGPAEWVDDPDPRTA